MTVENPTTTLSLPAIGPEGEPCTSCGMPLAADQRYCLECGQRRGAPPLPFGRLMEGSPPAAPPPAARGPWYREARPGFGIAAAAVLLFALGLGVLIGSLGEDPAQTQSVAAARPQVITVQAGGAAVPVAEFTSDWPSGQEGYAVVLEELPKDSSDVAAVNAAKQAAQGKGAADVGALDSDEYASLDSGNYVIYTGVFDKRAQAARALKKLKRDFPDARVARVSASGDADALSGKKKEATVDRNQLKELQRLSPDEYRKKSAKLPDTTKLPGAAPPKDNKKPGGGSDEGAIEIK